MAFTTSDIKSGCKNPVSDIRRYLCHFVEQSAVMMRGRVDTMRDDWLKNSNCAIGRLGYYAGLCIR